MEFDPKRVPQSIQQNHNFPNSFDTVPQGVFWEVPWLISAPFWLNVRSFWHSFGQHFALKILPLWRPSAQSTCKKTQTPSLKEFSFAVGSLTDGMYQFATMTYFGFLYLPCIVCSYISATAVARCAVSAVYSLYSVYICCTSGISAVSGVNLLYPPFRSISAISGIYLWYWPFCPVRTLARQWPEAGGRRPPLSE